MLSTQALAATFGAVRAVDRVSFTVAPGERVGLIGPNGAGKTTLINLITGALVPSEGTAWLDDRRLTGASPDRIARWGVVRTYQQARLFGGATVLENVAVGAHGTASAGPLATVLRTPRFRRTEAALRTAAVEALARVHSAGLAEMAVAQLTAGQQRLVSVARAIASRPRVLVLDEPAAGLSDAERDVLARDLRDYLAANQTSLILVEHHIGFVAEVCDRVIVLAEGRVLAQGPPSAIRQDPRVIDAYLGAA
jgi:branched-chain amino acid transport system ATP-binding protein